MALPKSDMADWPLSLKRNVAVVDLAEQLYTSRNLFYRIRGTWNELGVAQREVWIAKAEQMLADVAPGSVVPMLRHP